MSWPNFVLWLLAPASIWYLLRYWLALAGQIIGKGGS